MLSSNRYTSLVAAVVGAFILALTQPPVAMAAARATAVNSTLSISSATLRVFAADTMTASSTGTSYVVNVNKSTPKTFYIRNTGSLTSTAFTIAITLDNATAKISALTRCNLGVYFGTTLKKCGPTNINGVGVITTATKPPYSSVQTLTLAPGTGNFYAFQIDLDTTCNMTVNITANIANIPAGVLTNS